jgi:methyltransferase (TIGR00027 family)
MGMTSKAAETGPGAMGLVALEQLNFPEEKRVIIDKLAFKILPRGQRAVIWLKSKLLTGTYMVNWMEREFPGLWGSILCRKRYIDEKISEVVNGAQGDAVINLGAGFDTRAFRLPVLSGFPVWELDQPENIVTKWSRLNRIFSDVPPHVKLVPIDFNREELDEVLSSAGYSNHDRTFFIWEGVSQYLTESGVRKTFDFLSRAAAGSRLVFTYVRRDFIEGKSFYGLESLYQRMVRKNRTWLFGINPDGVSDFLNEYGWRVLEHLGYDDLVKRYVEPTGRELTSMPIERIVYAEKADG